MRRVLFCLLALSGLSLTGCGTQTTHFVLHNTPGCRVSTQHPEVDRERTYLATLLALKARNYVILETETPTRIVASYVSGNAPGIARVRWLIGIGPDASLNVDVADEQREMHPKVAGWYHQLLATVIPLQCRDTDWLRWEAQNQGLIPIGAYADSAFLPDGTSSGDEAATAAPSASVRSTVRVHPNAARIADLENKRAELHYIRSFVFAGVGAGVALAGVYWTLFGAISLSQGCYEENVGFASIEHCGERDAGRVLVPLGASAFALGGAITAISLALGFTRMQEFRNLGRELKLLRAANLSLNHDKNLLQGDAWSLSLRGSF